MTAHPRRTIGILVYDGLELGGHRPAGEVAALDVLVVPGTVDVSAALTDVALLRTVGQLAARSDVGSVVTGVRFVGDDRVVTAAGLSSGLALGLHLVDRLVGRDLAVATARQLEHPFDPEGRDGVPASPRQGAP